MASVLHNNQSCLRSKIQRIPLHLQDDSNHWIRNWSQPSNQLRSPDYGGNYKEPTICEGKLLSLSKILPDGSQTSANRSPSRYVFHKQDDRTSGSFTKTYNIGIVLVFRRFNELSAFKSGHQYLSSLVNISI